MSRSYRKTPIHGITTARSEKDDKRIMHGMMRAAERTGLAKLRHVDADEFILPESFNEIFNVWSMAKDGRTRSDRAERPRRTRRGGFDLQPGEDWPWWPAHKCWGK